MSKIIETNRLRDVYLVNEGNRVVFIPAGWCDEMSVNDEDDGLCVNCWVGNENALNFTKRLSGEWFTYESQEYYAVTDLEKMNEISEEQARRIDPDLFTLLEAVNTGTAK